jgi:photosystem II stability/assembly factor-like uncharacterized protein
MNSRFLVPALCLALAGLAHAARPALTDAASTAYTPRPAEPAPIAAKRLMLGLADTGERLIAVGDRGHILASNDGHSWAQVLPPVRTPLMAVSFVDSKLGWAVGQDAVILHTTDGGRNWVLQGFEPERRQPLLDVAFLDAQHGFAVGGFGLFLKTSDGGLEWREVEAPAIRRDELHLYRIAKLANHDLLVTGEQGMLALSTDGGQHWTRLKSPTENTLFGAAALAGGAVICGLHGEAWLSGDVRSGKWRRLETGTESTLFTATALDVRRVALAGANGRVLIVDAGGKLTALQSPDGAALSAIAPHAGGFVLAGEHGLQWLGGQR